MIIHIFDAAYIADPIAFCGAKDFSINRSLFVQGYINANNERLKALVGSSKYLCNACIDSPQFNLRVLELTVNNTAEMDPAPKR